MYSDSSLAMPLLISYVASMVAKHFVKVVYYLYTTSTFNYSFHSFYAVSRELAGRKSILGSVLFMGLGLGFIDFLPAL